MRGSFEDSNAFAVAMLMLCRRPRTYIIKVWQSCNELAGTSQSKFILRGPNTFDNNFVKQRSLEVVCKVHSQTFSEPETFLKENFQKLD